MTSRHAGTEFFADTCMALEAGLTNRRPLEQPGIRRAVRCVAGRAAFKLQRTVLENEWALLVRVASDARRIRTDGQLRLLLLVAAVWVMTVTARHGPFQDFVMKRFAELCLCLVVAGHAKLRLILLEHLRLGKTGVLM
jgi:hypothetical protein